MKKTHKIKPYFKWFDLWIGFFWDKKNGFLYFQLLPMIGLRIHLKHVWVNADNYGAVYCEGCNYD